MKLPQIIYNTPTETLGRYKSRAPQIIEKTGMVIGEGIKRAGRIEGQAIQQAGKIIGQSITEAGSRQAKGIYAAEKMANDARAKRQYNLEKLDIQADLARDQAMISAASGLAQTALTVGAKWYAAEQQAKKDNARTEAASKMQALFGGITRDSKTDLNNPAYSGFTTAYSGPTDQVVDPQTGQTMDMAPTHKVSGDYWEQGFAQIKDEALSKVSGDADRDELETQLNAMALEYSVKLADVNAKMEKAELTGLYMESIDGAMKNGDYHDARKQNASAYATGIFSPQDYAKNKAFINDTEQHDNFIFKIDSLSIEKGVPKEEITKLRTDITNSNNPKESQLRTALRMKENELEALDKEAKTAIEKSQQNTWFVQNAGKYVDTDMTGQEALNAFREDAIAAGFTEDLSQLASKFKTEWNFVKNSQDRRKVETNNSAWDGLTDTNQMPTLDMIPPTATGAVKKSMQDYVLARQQGREVKLDVNRWNQIQDMMVQDPAAFKGLNLTAESGKIPRVQLDALRSAQNKMIKGNAADLTEMQTFNGEVNDAIYQIFGKTEAMMSEKEMQESIGLKVMAQAVLQDFELRTGKKADPIQRMTLLNDLFKSKIKVNYNSWRGAGRTKEVDSMRRSDIDTNAFQVLSRVRSRGLPVTRQNITDTYNEMVITGEIR